MKQRIQYLDIAKAIMILLLIFHHYPHKIHGHHIELVNLSTLTCWHEWFTVFFMQAFFFITGYCSNFSKPFTSFFLSRIKTIIIPACIFIIINDIGGGDFVELLKGEIGIWDFFIKGAKLWFLWALFLASNIHWLLRKFPRLYPLLALLMMLVGYYYNTIDTYNALYFQNSFMLTPFIAIGEAFKMYDKRKGSNLIQNYGKYVLIAYLGIMSSLILLNLPRPIVTGMMIIGSIKEIPLHIVLGTFGLISIIYISAQIKNNLLANIGKQTLIIYGLHGLIYNIVVNIANKFNFFDFNYLVADYAVCVAICLTVWLCSYLLAIVLNKFSLGKYITGKW